MEAGTASAVPMFEQRHSLLLSRLSDELLARQVTRGSARAFSALYQRYHQQLYRYCRSILREDADAQDAVQAAFTAAFSALRRDLRNAPLRPWIFRIAHNEAITILRQRRLGERDLAPAPAIAISAEEHALERARWTTLISDIRGLPARQRGALLLRELTGLSHEEIATSLETSVGAAKQAIFEARQALAELEEGRAMSCEDIRRRLSDGDRRVIRGRRIHAHLRACSGCAAFAESMTSRRAELRALVPVLPPAAAAALFSRSLDAASLHAAGGIAAAGAGGAAATGVTSGGAASMGGAAAGTALASKAVASLALVAVTAAGAAGLSHALRSHHIPAAHAKPPVARLGSGATARQLPRFKAGTDAAPGTRAHARLARGSSAAGKAAGASRSRGGRGGGFAGSSRRRSDHPTGAGSSAGGAGTSSAANSGHRSGSGSSGSHGGARVQVSGKMRGNTGTSSIGNATSSAHSHGGDRLHRIGPDFGRAGP